jgi:hypothetical protein
LWLKKIGDIIKLIEGSWFILINKEYELIGNSNNNKTLLTQDILFAIQESINDMEEIKDRCNMHSAK